MTNTLRVLHLTDTHAFGDDTLHYGHVDTGQQLARVLAGIDLTHQFDLVVCSGDVSEDGTEESYERVAAALSEFARARGARVVYAMGNHDRRSEFRTVLGAGQPGVATAEPIGQHEAEPHESRPVVSSATVNGWRTIVLDSSVPGRGHGELDDTQLQFLRTELSAPAEYGTVVVVHHPPVDAQTDLLQALALQRPEAFLEAIADTDVAVVLSGHYHLPIVEHVRGLTFSVAPGVANVARSVDHPGVESSTVDSGGAIVEICDGRVRVTPFVLPSQASDAFHLGAEQVHAIIEHVGPDAP